MNGGNVYVNCDGDGLDANGNLYLYGGTAVVLAQETGHDNSPLDFDGTCVIKGATVFAAGGNSMGENPDTSSSQTVTYVGGNSSGGFGGPGGNGGGFGGPGGNNGNNGNNGSTTTYAAGSIISVKNGSTVVFNETLTKDSDYILFSSPSVNSTVTFATANSLDYSITDAFKGTWNLSSTTKGTTTTTTDGSYTIYNTTAGSQIYTCSENSNTETKTVAASVSYVCDGHEDSSSSEVEEGQVYKANFNVSEEGTAKINVYYSQNYGTVSEEDVSEALARDKTSGEEVTSGGQINFEVVCSDGYEVESVTVTPGGNYTNLKDHTTDPDSLSENMYRITKLTGDVVVNIKTRKAENNSGDNGDTSGDNGNTSGDNGNTSGDNGNSSGDNGNTSGDNGNSSNDNSSLSTAADGPIAGTKLSYKKYYYKVIKAGSSDGSIIGELQVTGLRKKSVTTIKIAAKVTIGGITYKVTSIKAGAFKGNSKATKVFIGKNIETIGNAGFANMSKVKAVSINSTVLTKIGANAFMKDTKLAKVTIKSKKLKTIGKKAFFGDKKLVRLTLKTTKLKTVGAKAFYRKGGKKLTIKVPSAKKKAYKKIFKKAKTNKYIVK